MGPATILLNLNGRTADRAFALLARSAALLTLALVVAMTLALAWGAWPAIDAWGLSFLTRNVWDPVHDDYGGLAMMVGTLASAALAVLLAAPVGFGIAVFLVELCPTWLKRPLGSAVELLAAVPSIVYGMWGLLALGPVLATYVQQPLQAVLQPWPLLAALVNGPPVGIGILPAGVILAIMILPLIAAVMRDAFMLVPAVLKESAYGLGATTWEVVWQVVLPHARTGAWGGVLLGLARALGETMAVTFVIGNVSQLQSFSLFDAANSIASVLANEFTESFSALHQSALMYLGLVLFVLTFFVLGAARWLLARGTR